MMNTFAMYDSVDGAAVMPSRPQAVAGYVSGSWPNYDALVSAFPDAHHLSIATNAWARARCLDVENGDATPEQVPGWLRDYAEPHPVIYASAANMETVQRIVDRLPYGNKVTFFSSHIGQGRHICSPARCGYPAVACTQWTFTAYGRNLDESYGYLGSVFPSAADPMHYNRYLDEPILVGGLYLSERATVKEYDLLRKNAKQHRERLGVLRVHCRLLRDRVSEIAHREDPPAWELSNRGWRWQKLNRRVNGESCT